MKIVMLDRNSVGMDMDVSIFERLGEFEAHDVADRKSCNERGRYLNVDKNSGLVKKNYDDVFAVNLETGQLRRFSHDYLVEKVEAEVFLKK